MGNIFVPELLTISGQFLTTSGTGLNVVAPLSGFAGRGTVVVLVGTPLSCHDVFPSN